MIPFFTKKEVKNSEINLLYIKSFATLSWLYIIAFSCIIGYVIKIILWNYAIYKPILDNWYNYTLLYDFINNNYSYFITFIIAYILFIGYIWSKKGILIESKTYQNYYQIFSYIYKGLSFLLLPFLFYLWKIKSYHEFLVLIFIVYLFNTLLALLLTNFSNNLNNIKTLEFLNNKDNFKTTTYLSLNSFLNRFLPYFIWISITFSILVIPIWLLLKYNIFSILYLHVSFIMTFIGLNILTNKFAWLIDLKYDWKMFKRYYLLENTKEKVIIVNEKESLIMKPEKVDFIRFIHKK